MSVLTEFLLIACVLFLWESTLWLPLRSMTLRRRGFGHRWRLLPPDRLLVMRDLGLVPMLPVPPDYGLAPCQAPPLIAGDQDALFLEISCDRLIPLPAVTWEDLREEPHYLWVAGYKSRISSPRCLAVLRRAKRRGATPQAAVRQAWRLALSPVRAGREWRRWHRAAGPLHWLGPVLTLGFFVALPMIYIHRGSQSAVMFALWLWCLMAYSSACLWWLGKRIYPDARAALRMDAVLALLVPFHAMRALEIAAVHAMGTTHPIALILSTRDLSNPWLAAFVRRILHPFPGVAEDAGFAAGVRPPLTAALARCGKSLDDFDGAPDAAGDPEARGYCPRCHGLYLAHVTCCPDCHGLELRAFD